MTLRHGQAYNEKIDSVLNQPLHVCSRDDVVRVDLEWDRIFGPSLADGLERRSPSQRFEVLGGVVSGDEGLHVGLEALQARVMETLTVASFTVRFIRSACPLVQG